MIKMCKTKIFINGTELEGISDCSIEYTPETDKSNYQIPIPNGYKIDTNLLVGPSDILGDPDVLPMQGLGDMMTEHELEMESIRTERLRNDPATATGIDLDYFGELLDCERKAYSGGQQIETDEQYRIRLLVASKGQNITLPTARDDGYAAKVVKICSCNSRDLFNFGCKCGYVTGERL